MGLDGLEALRLADLEGLYQEAAAEHMGVSRPTFARILARAHAAVAEALVVGKVLVIGEAPVVEGASEPIPCPIHWGGRRRGRTPRGGRGTAGPPARCCIPGSWRSTRPGGTAPGWRRRLRPRYCHET